MNIEELLQQAIENRCNDQYEAYLDNYNVLINHLNSEDVYKEYMLGDYYLEASGHKDKTMRFRNPVGHPVTNQAEYIDLVIVTEEKEFPDIFTKWMEKTGKEAAMMACIKFINGGRNDLSLVEYDLKTIQALSNFDTETAYRALDQILRENDKKIWGQGARSLKHVNAAIKTLVRMGTPRALQSLLRLQQYARYAKPEKSINVLMADLKLSDAEIEDLKSPTYNFDENLSRTETLGDYLVIMSLLPDYKMERQISKVDGTVYVDFPKQGLDEYKDEIKELKGLEKIVFQDMRRYRDRIENTYRSGHTWKFSDWQQSNMFHPLIAYSARRLIWEFTCEMGPRYTGLWSTNQQTGPDTPPQVILHDASGNPLPVIDDKWNVKLWHPVEASPEEHAAWKDRVIELKVVQPFKQAFREIYSITPPELLTRTYTNRFAAHILFRHQFTAIAASRGWDIPNYYSDNIYDPSVSIRGHPIIFHIDAGERFGAHVGTDKIDFGVDINSVPPIVFSEALRDVDMFVSVCSIGVDPTWTPDRECYNYWTQYTTQELTDSAVNRKDVLQRILSELSIADKCRIEDRWLFVEGKMSTYKIHIGSGSVHMEPSNKHLCIVPQPAKKSEGDTIYLPFESDAMLSLILSKAFLLVNDAKITDRTILLQIKSKG